MAFLNEDDNIKFSPKGRRALIKCESIQKESNNEFVFTENELRINTSSCGESIFGSQAAGYAYDDNFVTITNDCTTTLHITGLVNSNPNHFSLFEYPNYRNNVTEYNESNVPDFPVTLNPFESFKIPTFMHISNEELQLNPGGEFSAEIAIYPGFPISNCDEGGISCDASFTLTGKISCEEKSNGLDISENYFPSDAFSVGIFNPFIEAKTCIESTPLLKFTAPIWDNDNELMNILSLAAQSYYEAIQNNGQDLEELYLHIGMAGALQGFKKLCDESTSINDLKNGNLNNEKFSYVHNAKTTVMNVNYDSSAITFKNINGDYFDGMTFDVETDSGSKISKNQTVFFRTEANDTIYITTANQGDYENHDLC
jgi:hypothetical protein